MKFIIALCFLCLPGLSSLNAQPVSGGLRQSPRPHPADMDALATLEWHRQQRGAQKATAVVSRLIGNATSTGTAAGAWQLRDSSWYVYQSPDRGGDDRSAVVGYGLRVGLQSDTGVNMVWNIASQAYQPYQRILKTFDAGHRELTTTMQQWQNGAWQNSFRISISYDGQGRDTLVLSENWHAPSFSWVNSYQDQYTYNTAGQVTLHLSRVWNSAAASWRNSGRNTTTYDAAGNEIQFLSESWNTVSASWYNSGKSDYTYTTANELQSSTYQSYDIPSQSWVNVYHYLYYYNGGNQLTGFTYRSGTNGTGWINSDSVAYPLLNASGQPLTGHTYDWNNGWLPMGRFQNTYTGGGLIGTTVSEAWTGSTFINSGRTFTFYNSFDQRTHYYSQSWDNQISSWVMYPGDRDERFYYETITTGVGQASSAAIRAYLHPVPAQQSVQLVMQWPAPVSFHGAIIDAAGRIVHQWTDKASGEYLRILQVGHLPAGTYLVRINGQGGLRWTGRLQVAH